MSRVVKKSYKEVVTKKGIVWELIPKAKTRNAQKVERKFHNFQVSRQSQKKIVEKITWLHYWAKERTIKTYSGKTIYNFRTAFITLTLPSKQKHPTAYISKEIFERFLTLLRNHLKMTNYVWKLEFQKNGNVHYHLVTDTYIDYFYCLKKWNDILQKHGYISDYKEKMQNLSFSEYRQLESNKNESDIKKLASRYAKGKSENWSNPNTVHINSVKSGGNIAHYIAKYIGKNESDKGGNELDDEENSFGLRLAFWSRSLSKAEAISLPFDFYNFSFSAMFESTKNVIVRVFDYCKVAYFNLKKLENSAKRELFILFNQMRSDIGYIPA